MPSGTTLQLSRPRPWDPSISEGLIHCSILIDTRCALSTLYLGASLQTPWPHGIYALNQAARARSFGDIVSLAQCASDILRASMGDLTFSFIAEIDARAPHSPNRPADAQRAIGRSLTECTECAECAALLDDVDRWIAGGQAALRQGSWRKIEWSVFKREELVHIAAHWARIHLA